jgi:hypothetical protein
MRRTSIYAIITMLRTPVVHNASTLLGLNHPDKSVGFNQKPAFLFVITFYPILLFICL